MRRLPLAAVLFVLFLFFKNEKAAAQNPHLDSLKIAAETAARKTDHANQKAQKAAQSERVKFFHEIQIVFLLKKARQIVFHNPKMG